MDEFYIQTISSACVDAYADNSPSKFVNYMTEPFILPNANWLVGLTEIQYCHRHEIHKPKNVGKILIFDFLAPRGGGEGADRLYGLWNEVECDFSNIHTGVELASYLNTILWKNLKRTRRSKVAPFVFDSVLNKFWYCYDPSLWYLILLKGFVCKLVGLTNNDDPNQVAALGLSKGKSTYTYRKKTRNFAPDARSAYKSKCSTRNFFKYEPLTEINKDITQFVIYCSIVTDNIVAGERVPNLRVVDLNADNSGKTVTKLFTRPYYFRLASTVINSVQIELRSLSGELLDLAGVTRIVLHIKPAAS